MIIFNVWFINWCILSSKVLKKCKFISTNNGSDKVTFLGSTLSRSVHIDDEVTAGIAKDSVAFGRLRRTVWDRNEIRFDKKLKVYEAVVLPTLLYACETWTVYQRHAKRLNDFHLCCLRKLLNIRWQDKIPDTKFLRRAGM